MLKNLKKINSIIAAALMLLVSLVPASSTAATSVLPGTKYVALGDSVTVGISAIVGTDYSSTIYNGYAKQFYDNLKSKNKNINFYNLGVNGAKSSDLRTLVNDKKNALTLKNANFITINIGGNNLLGPVLDSLYSLYPGVSDINSLYSAVSTNSIPLYSYLNSLQFSNSDQSTELNAALAAGAAVFSSDFQNTINKLHSLAPNAKVYVNTVYNPIKYPSDDTSITLHNILDFYINIINNSINSYSSQYKYTVVDVNAAFESSPAPVLSFNLPLALTAATQPVNKPELFASYMDIHPTLTGHGVIASLLEGSFKN